ncbi:nucleoside phosphorylase [Dinghuibacter silviterrae]|uniref:Uridine phosphorylase n=1 Tax=Dinghuibacter silviterrae TaxID=1539049 RepID=A0A4R8DHE0_9BACT|nr:nucleoside phosphorylase [Dinghuibacter silviterrae]TDW96654.1 uridine phosphorylase [Dinghuibacter silviterrae]
MQKIADSELILNERGAVYHLDLRPEEVAHTVVTVGDPDRVKEVSKHFDSIEVRRQHREFVSHTGRVGKKRLTVVSTGIGTDNIDIVFNELDALVNIDLEKRMVKDQLTSLRIVRVGTSGSLQKDVPVDSFLASTHGLGLDNLLHFYRAQPNDEEKQLVHAFVTHTGLNGTPPYISGAASSLMKHFVEGFHRGITVTCPGFYGPQGRVLRLGLMYPELIDRLGDFRFGAHRITNFEMETAGIYGLGRLLGHACLSLNAIVANRVEGTFTKDGAKTIESLIRKTLSILEQTEL